MKKKVIIAIITILLVLASLITIINYDVISNYIKEKLGISTQMSENAGTDSAETLIAESVDDGDCCEGESDDASDENTTNTLDDLDQMSVEEQYYSIYQNAYDSEHTINEKLYERKNLFSKALHFLKDVPYINDYFFCSNHHFDYFPKAEVLEYFKVYYELGLSSATRIKYLLPFKNRYIENFSSIDPQTDNNYKAYVQTINMLVQNRLEINFFELYKNYRPLVLSIIDKEFYTKNFKIIVDRLLVAYDDLETDRDKKYKHIDNIMLSHFKRNHVRNIKGGFTIDFATYYNELEPMISEDARQQFEKIYQEQALEKNTYLNQESIIWSYSFWNRRRLENNTDNIHKLLKAIDSDYTDYEL